MVMKSVFLSILIFAAVFLFAGSGVLSVIGEDWFHYSTYFVFALVMICAVYVTLIRGNTATNNNLEQTPEDNTAETKQKEEKHDKK